MASAGVGGGNGSESAAGGEVIGLRASVRRTTFGCEEMARLLLLAGQSWHDELSGHWGGGEIDQTGRKQAGGAGVAEEEERRG